MYSAIACYDAVENTEVSFQEGDTLELLRVGQEGWWFAQHTATAQQGWVPASYLTFQGMTNSWHYYVWFKLHINSVIIMTATFWMWLRSVILIPASNLFKFTLLLAVKGAISGILRRLANIYNFVICNQPSSFSVITTLVYFWFVTSLVFFLSFKIIIKLKLFCISEEKWLRRMWHSSLKISLAEAFAA